MPKCHKIYPNCIWQVPIEWHKLGFYSTLLAKVYWNYATHIVRVCVTLIPPKTSKMTLLIKVISKFTLTLKQWLVCTSFSAITLLHLRIHSSKNYSPSSLHLSTLISSITLPTNTLQMMNQFIQSTLQFLHFIPMIQHTFFEYFYILLIFMQLQDFYHHRWVQNIQKGCRPRTTDDPGEGPKAYSTSIRPPSSTNFTS